MYTRIPTVTPKMIDTLYRQFVDADDDNSGTIDAEEFHVMFRDKKSPFLDYLFNVMGRSTHVCVRMRESSWAVRICA